MVRPRPSSQFTPHEETDFGVKSKVVRQRSAESRPFFSSDCSAQERLQKTQPPVLSRRTLLRLLRPFQGSESMGNPQLRHRSRQNPYRQGLSMIKLALRSVPRMVLRILTGARQLTCCFIFWQPRDAYFDLTSRKERHPIISASTFSIASLYSYIHPSTTTPSQARQSSVTMSSLQLPRSNTRSPQSSDCQTRLLASKPRGRKQQRRKRGPILPPPPPAPEESWGLR